MSNFNIPCQMCLCLEVEDPRVILDLPDGNYEIYCRECINYYYETALEKVSPISRTQFNLKSLRECPNNNINMNINMNNNINNHNISNSNSNNNKNIIVPQQPQHLHQIEN